MPHFPPIRTLGVANHPLRPVDWRWRAANEQVRTGRPVIGALQDPLLVRMVRYLRSRHFSAAVAQCVTAQMADVHEAIALRDHHRARSLAAIYSESPRWCLGRDTSLAEASARELAAGRRGRRAWSELNRAVAQDGAALRRLRAPLAPLLMAKGIYFHGFACASIARRCEPALATSLPARRLMATNRIRRVYPLFRFHLENLVMEDAMSFKATHPQTADPQPAVDPLLGSPWNTTSNTATPAPHPLDLAARRAQRQPELLAAWLAPQPRGCRSRIGWRRGIGVLFSAAQGDQGGCGHRLLPGMRTYAVFVRLAERLS